MCKRRKKAVSATAEELLSECHKLIGNEKFQPTISCPAGGLTVLAEFPEGKKTYDVCPCCGMVFREVKR